MVHFAVMKPVGLSCLVFVNEKIIIFIKSIVIVKLTFKISL